MKSIVYRVTGEPSVLELVEREIPQPGPGEVRIRVIVSGVNPTDWKSRRGAAAGTPLDFAEVTPDQDGAGVVDALGEGVEGLAVGDRVWLYLAAHQRPTGTAQEFTVVPADRAVLLPEGVDWDVAASLGVPAMTAHRALTVHEDGPSRLAPGALAGRTVLVAGGAGAVGHAAIQLGVWAGATVIATVSGDDKGRLASAAGAHHVVNYREADAAERIRSIAPNGVEIVVEVSIAHNADLDAKILATRGVVAMYADDGGQVAPIAIRPNMGLNARYQFILLYTVGADALRAAAEDVTAALHDAALPVGEAAGLPLHRFPLADTAGAHAAVEAGVVGKVLVDVQSE
ncbi:NADPH:quinone reductase [Microbacteriaceae bacterium VKM Ac-2855]|nr:NADPH:quinone reductase [Microbacteriaceae bacterium VKM Ac-2855]